MLERKSLAIVEDKIAYINKLEELKNSFKSSRLNNFLFNISSKKLVLKDDFDWSFINFNLSVVVPYFKGITTNSSSSL